MRNILIVLAMAFAVAFAGNIRLEEPVEVTGSDDMLQYDDGSAFWLTWGGLYRGVWFDTEDFLPGSNGLECEYTQFWFYHHADYPWDVSEFYAELWNGESSAPITLLDQSIVTATHYSANNCNYSSAIVTDADFWALVNTEMSAGGWPAILGDDSPNTTDHSFYSDDFIIWEPWILSGSTASDYFIRASGTIQAALDSESWGQIKGLYR